MKNYKEFAIKALNEVKGKTLLETRKEYAEKFSKTALTENDGANICHALVNQSIVNEIPLNTFKKLLPIVDSLEGKKLELHRAQQKFLNRMRTMLNVKPSTFDRKEFQGLMKRILETKKAKVKNEVQPEVQPEVIAQ